MDLVRQRAISKGASQVLGTSHWAKVKGENDNILVNPLTMAWFQGIWWVEKVLVYKLYYK